MGTSTLRISDLTRLGRQATYWQLVATAISTDAVAVWRQIFFKKLILKWAAPSSSRENTGSDIFHSAIWPIRL